MRKGFLLCGLASAAIVAFTALAASGLAEPARKSEKAVAYPPIPQPAAAPAIPATSKSALPAQVAAPGAQTLKGVRIELKVPQVPAISGKQKPDAAKANTAATEAMKQPSKSWPKTLPEAEAEKKAASAPPATWSATEIADAKARCTAILKRIHAIAIPQDAIKEGVCGTPAPVQLISIGRNPEVALSPPAIVNCDFAEALQTWLDSDVQPLAKKQLGAHVIKIEVMSSYSCRNAYGRKGNKLSEHGLANALDIRGFVTAAGKTAYVLENWGTPQREINARIAAEKAKAAKALAEAQAADKAAQAAQQSAPRTGSVARAPAAAPPAATGSQVGAPASGIARSTITDGTPKLTVTIPGASRTDEADSESEGAFSIAPNRLGGPKVQVKVQINSPAEAAKNKVAAGERKETFLHSAHAAACRLFGTTLGPEANAAHRNHLHIDMAERRGGIKICD